MRAAEAATRAQEPTMWSSQQPPPCDRQATKMLLLGTWGCRGQWPQHWLLGNKPRLGNPHFRATWLASGQGQGTRGPVVHTRM